VHLPALFGNPKTLAKTRFNTKELTRTPLSKDEDIREEVDGYLEKVRPRVRAFLKKDNPCDLAELRIPFVEGKPRLSLHDLGGTVVEKEVVDGVFKKSKTCAFCFQSGQCLRID
jgi:hypothetical protein